MVGKKLPDGWVWAELDDVTLEYVSGGTPSTKVAKYWSGGIPWTRSANITAKYLRFGEKFISSEAITDTAANIVPKNNVLVATRVGVGKSTVNLIDVAISQDLTGLILDLKRILPIYLVYYLHSPRIQKTLEQYSRGTTIKGIQRSDLSHIKVPLPPLDTQRKIVAILDKAEATQRLRAEADALTQELQRSAFLEIFGNPVKNEKGWVKKPLREFGEIITGNTPPRERAEYYGNHIEWIKSDNINTPFTYLTRSEEMLSKQGADVGRIAPKGSVLITCIAGSISCIGNTAIADREVAFNQQINAIVPNKSVNPVFLYHLFRNSQGYIQKFSTHSMKGMISKGVLSSIPLILPPVEIQDSFASIAQQIEEIRNQQHESTYEVSSLLNALMSKAFIGELISN